MRKKKLQAQIKELSDQLEMFQMQFYQAHKYMIEQNEKIEYAVSEFIPNRAVISDGKETLEDKYPRILAALGLRQEQLSYKELLRATKRAIVLSNERNTLAMNDLFLQVLAPDLTISNKRIAVPHQTFIAYDRRTSTATVWFEHKTVNGMPSAEELKDRTIVRFEKFFDMANHVSRASSGGKANV